MNTDEQTPNPTNTDRDEVPTEALNDRSVREPIAPFDPTDLTVLKYKVIAAAMRAATSGDRASLECVLDSLNDGWTAWNQAQMERP